MSNDASGFKHLKKAREDRQEGSGSEEEAEEPKNLSNEDEEVDQSSDKPKNLSSKEPKSNKESTSSSSSDEKPPESSPPNADPSSQTANSNTRRRSSRSHGEQRRSGSSSRKEKAFMFGPEEERRFNHLLADVRSLVRQEYPRASVQNSQLVRAMIEMTIEDLDEGEDLIIDYVLDQIDQERENP